jgi:uncharacterized phage protein gp47/JayE
MALPTKSFNQIVTDQATAMQAQTNNIKFPVGSINLGLIQANAGIGLWIQAMVLEALNQFFANTARGINLDTWMAQFQFTRNAATQTTGNCTFSRFTATGQAVVPVGSQVETTSPSIIVFTVYADTDNPNYSAVLDGYVMANTVATVSVPVIANVAGTSGNVGENTINAIVGTIVGVDQVNNPLAFSDGEDAESDAAFFARFILFINSLFAASLSAVEYAVSSVADVRKSKVVSNKNQAGDEQRGFFYVSIYPYSTANYNAVVTTVSRVRGLTIDFGVYEAAALAADVTATVTIQQGYVSNDVKDQIIASITTFINSTAIQIGGTLRLSDLIWLIKSANESAIISISGLQINSVAADLTSTNFQLIVPGAFNISIVVV